MLCLTKVHYSNTNTFKLVSGAAEATFDRSGQASPSILQKGLHKSIRIQQCFLLIFILYARFRVIVYGTSKCVVHETQYKAISYV